MSIWQFSEDLPAVPQHTRITLGEGNTPLIRSARIGPTSGFSDLYFKLETSNPTGSYKDRFAAMAISDMLSKRQTRCVATSSGNTGSALAAYCAVAGLDCHIATVETAPDGKLQQMLAYGADVFRVRGFGLDADISRHTFELLSEIGAIQGNALQISAFKYSPFGMAGVQSISYELYNQLPDGIDHVFCPAGGGGLTLAVARGFQRRAKRKGNIHTPSIHCVQPNGNNTIAGPLQEGKDNAAVVNCTSRISGLQVPSVIDGDDVIQACRSSGGNGHLVSDDQIFEIQSRLACEEGIFCEPAGAVALAGAISALQNGLVKPSDRVVCLVTGSGFKDQASIDSMNSDRTTPWVDHSDISQRLTGK